MLATFAAVASVVGQIVDTTHTQRAEAFERLPRQGGAGFGTALITPARDAAVGNPAGLPSLPEIGGAVHRSTDVYDYIGYRIAIGPVAVGGAWGRGPLRVAVSYARLADSGFQLLGPEYDENGDPLPPNDPSRSDPTSTGRFVEDRVAVGAAFVVPHTGEALVVGARVGRAGISNRFDRPAVGSDPGYSSDNVVHGIGWSVGVVVAPQMLPLRAGVFYEARTELSGTRTCSSGAGCQRPVGLRGRVPSRIEASVGVDVGPAKVDGTVARVAWSEMEGLLPYGSSVPQDAVEAGSNVRVPLREGLHGALGFHTRRRNIYSPKDDDATVQLDPTRLLLVGLTYVRGPVVLDAAYVNSTLLSDENSRFHLGQVGLAYRF